MAEYNFQTFKQMNLWCNSQGICLTILSNSISAVYESQNLSLYIFQINKCVRVTELDFVFDNKENISKNFKDQVTCFLSV